MKKIFFVVISTLLSVNISSASPSNSFELVEIPILTETAFVDDSTPRYELTFYLTDKQIRKAKSAVLEFVIVGVCCGSRVVLNDRSYHLNDSEDLYRWWDSLGKTVIPVQRAALNVGLNTIVFEGSEFNPSSSNGNLNDDFQFRDVSLVLEYENYKRKYKR